MRRSCLTACVLPAPHRLTTPAFEAHPRANTFPPEADSSAESTFHRAHPLPATPFQCPRSRTATLGEGATATYLPLRWPDCTLSRLRAEEYDGAPFLALTLACRLRAEDYDRPATQSMATPEPSSRTIPTLDRTLVASVSPHSGADGLCPG